MKKIFVTTLLGLSMLLSAQSARDSLKILQSSIKQLTSEKNESDKENEKLKLDVSNLTEKLSRVDRSYPIRINVGEVKVLDDKVFVQFELDKPGFINVKVYRNLDAGEPELSIKSNYEISPMIELKKLSTNTDYYIVANVTDYLGRERETSVSFRDSPRLKVKTLEALQRPNISFGNPIVKHNQIAFSMNIDAPVNYMLTYNRVDNIMGNRKYNREGGINEDIKPDRFGQINNVTNIDYIQVDNLRSNTEYHLDFTFFDKYGKSYKVEKNFTTLGEPKSLDFTDGVKVEFNSLKSTITWKFSKKPNTAFVNFQTEDGNTHIQTGATIYDDYCLVDLDSNKFKNLLNVANKANGQGLPKINVVMIDDRGTEKKMTFEVKVSLPTEKEITDANNLTQNERKEMLKSAKEIRGHLSGEKQGGKIDWESIVKIGVPILLTIL